MGHLYYDVFRKYGIYTNSQEFYLHILSVNYNPNYQSEAFCYDYYAEGVLDLFKLKLQDKDTYIKGLMKQ